MSTSPFRAELEQAVNARHSRMNPFTEQWVTGGLTRTQLGQWVCQHYQYVGQFSQWCAAVYAGCPDPDARDFLLENIIEEESGVKHVDLLIRFGEACGVTRAQVLSTRQLPTTRALTAWCYETSRAPFHVSSGHTPTAGRPSRTTARSRRRRTSPWRFSHPRRRRVISTRSRGWTRGTACCSPRPTTRPV